ncbi:MAG: ABC transporter permease [Clostridia bacterium]|nr:ABC transporter permease [Clostridia bacterium]
MCLIMFAFLAISVPKLFFNPFNIQALMFAIAPEGIVAIGMMILLISGVFDLSVGSVMAFAGLMTAMMLVAGLPIIVCIIIGLLVGVAIGFINGLLVEMAGINPLISTIGTMYIFRGATEFLMVGRSVDYNNFPEIFVNFGRKGFLGVYWMFWILIILVVVFTIFIVTRPTGKRLYFIGGNENLAKLMGIKKRKIRIGAYMISGLLAALAGILMTAKNDAANRYIGNVTHMNVIIACVIGGGSLNGGQGSIPGALFGIIFLSFLQNAFNLFDFESSMQRIILGFVLMAVVSVDGFMTLRRQKELGRI